MEHQESAEIAALANSTLARFQKVAQISSLDTAVSRHREALNLRAEPHVERSSSLCNLAIALIARFHHTSLCEDLDEGISLCREALPLLHKAHPNRPHLLNTLSAALLTRYDKTAQPEDLVDAVSLRDEELRLGPGGNQGGVQGSGIHSESQLYVRVTDQLLLLVI
jgi:hypothetical protein